MSEPKKYGCHEYLTACFSFERLLHRGGVSVSAEDRALYEGPTHLVQPSQTPRLRAFPSALWSGFFQCAAEGYSFADPARIRLTFGQTLAQRCPRATPTFLRFATSYWTLKIIIDDLWRLDQALPGTTTTVLAQLLARLETDVASVFFPSPGPIRIPRFLRVRRQRKILAQSGAAIDIEEFLRSS